MYYLLDRAWFKNEWIEYWYWCDINSNKCVLHT